MKRLLATVLLAAMLCTVLVLIPAKETATEVFALDMPTTNGKTECEYYLPSASGNVRVLADFIPTSKSQRPGTVQTQKYLVIHNTGNYADTASAYNHYSWLISSTGTGQSYHYVCGSDGIYQLLPENERGYHTGTNRNDSGTYDSVALDCANSNAIGIETCVNLFPATASYSGEQWNTDEMYAWYTNYFATRTDYLAILSASILVRNNFDPNTRCVQHYVVYGKNCPMQMRYVFGTAGTSGYSGGSNTSHFTKMGTYYTIFWNRMMAYYNAYKNGGEAVMPDGGTSGTIGGIYKVSTSGDTLNIRDQATSSGSNVIGEIPDGTEITVTAYSGNWGKTTYNGVEGWVSMSYLTYVSAIPEEVDEEAPVISDAKVSDLDGTGYTVTCKVSDNKGVSKVLFPTWTVAGGQDDIKWLSGTISNGTASIRVKISDFANASGAYSTHIYAYDAAENASEAVTLSITVPAISYPSNGIPVYEFEGSNGVENAVIWTSAKTDAFTSVYWGAALLAPQSDGTYKITSIAFSSETKSMTASGSNIILAIHESIEGYQNFAKLAVGDILVPYGINVANKVLTSQACFALDSNFDLVDGSSGSLSADVYNPNSTGNTVSSVKSAFQCDVTIIGLSGSALGSSDAVGTGCKVVQYADDGTSVLNEVAVIVTGDLTGDGVISSVDIASHKAHIRVLTKLTGHFLTAGDIDGNGKVDTIDYIRLKLAA